MRITVKDYHLTFISQFTDNINDSDKFVTNIVITSDCVKTIVT